MILPTIVIAVAFAVLIYVIYMDTEEERETHSAFNRTLEHIRNLPEKRWSKK